MLEAPMPDHSGRLIVRYSLRSRFGLLFLTLLLAIVLPTIIPPDTPRIALLATATVTAVLLSGLYAVADSKRHIALGLILLVPAIALEWLYHGVQARAIDIADRQAAIDWVITNATDGDTVIVAGRADEDFLIDEHGSVSYPTDAELLADSVRRLLPRRPDSDSDSDADHHPISS